MIVLEGVPAWALPRIRDNPRPRWLRDAEIALVTGRLRVIDVEEAMAGDALIWAAHTETTLYVWRETDRACSWELVAVAMGA